MQVREGKAIYCLDCGFVYYHNVAAAAAVILEYQDNILLTKRAKEPCKGGLDLPGGFIDYHESAETGLIREVQEELNLKIENPEFLTTAPNLYEYENIEYPVLDVIFYCNLTDISGIAARDDVAGFEWYEPQQIDLKTIAFPSTREGVRTYLIWKGYLEV